MMERLVGLDAASYAGLFLTEADLPSLVAVQDSRSQGADAADAAFGANGGMAAGFQAWSGSGDGKIGRLVDVRWVFPDAAAARAYHRESLRANSEGRTAVPYAPHVGDGCTVFGGTEPNPIAPEIEMTAFTYVFRVGNVVVKLFAFANPAATPPLAVTDVSPIAQRAVERILASP